jgi:hypothetical protein
MSNTHYFDSFENKISVSSSVKGRMTSVYVRREKEKEEKRTERGARE